MSMMPGQENTPDNTYHNDTPADDKPTQKSENNGIDKEGQNHIDLLSKKIRTVLRA